MALLFVAILALLGIGVSAILFSKKSTDPCPSGCNVIVIAVDTLSAKHTKLQGYERDTMPRVEAFFADDFIFEQAYSVSPWTLPSFASMYFSDLPNKISFKDFDGRSNLFSELRENNYAVAAVLHPGQYFIMDAIYRPFETSEKVLTKDTYTEASKTLAELQDTKKPFLLWLHTFEVHDPFAPKNPYDSYFETLEGYNHVTFFDLVEANAQDADPHRDQAYKLRYDQGIASLDDRLGGFLENLSQEVLDTTVIIVTSDHGEAFGEHGKVWHANGVYDEELHVPLYVRIPGMTGRNIENPVSLIDLAPTIFSFTNTEKPNTFKGESLAPLLLSGHREDTPLVFVNGMPYFLRDFVLNRNSQPYKTLKEAEAEGSEKPLIEVTSFGARLGSYKVISHTLPGEYIPQTLIFDLSNDPGEHSPLPLSQSDLPQKLTDALLTIFWRTASSTAVQ